MVQDDRHLTTEQLSAYLDGQVFSEERARWDSHLQDCEQCRQGLASLRQTAALLHALPQPVLPRSFVLSPTPTTQYAQSTTSTQNDPAAPISLETHRATRQATPVTKQRRRGLVYVQGALRGLSVIAAVAGLLLFISGLVIGASQGIATSTAGRSSDAKVGYAQSAPAAPNAMPKSSSANITPQASYDTKVATAPQMTPQLKPVPTAEIRKVLPTTSPLLPNLPFLDINAPAVRVGLGMLLVLLGVMGFIVFKQRRRQNIQG